MDNVLASIPSQGGSNVTQLQQVFNQFLEAKPILNNRQALTIAFTPENIPHREKQVQELGKMLAPALKGGRPSNIFVYGKTGTGKTLVATYVANELSKAASNKVKIIYINCKMKHTADTEYRLLAQIAKELGKEVPFTGLPTDMVYHKVFETMDSQEQTVILVIDEIDALIEKVGDGVLYNLTRINSDLKKAKLSIVGITNDLGFIDKLDPRVRSSLSEEEMIFPPYNAVQLQDILRQRLIIAADHGAAEDGVIEKCAALAAQEHGDARRALDLLRVAGELAERNGDSKIKVEHIDSAQMKIDQDRVVEVVKAQPKQSQAVLYAIIKLSEKKGDVDTGEVFEVYNKICGEHGMKPLTQRRVSDLIAELEVFRIIHAKVISRGRYGRTRMISLGVGSAIEQKTKKVLEEVFY